MRMAAGLGAVPMTKARLLFGGPAPQESQPLPAASLGGGRVRHTYPVGEDGGIKAYPDEAEVAAARDDASLGRQDAAQETRRTEGAKSALVLVAA